MFKIFVSVYTDMTPAFQIEDDVVMKPFSDD